MPEGSGWRRIVGDLERRYVPARMRQARQALMRRLWWTYVSLEAHIAPRRAMLWRGPGQVEQMRPDVLEDLAEYTELPQRTLLQLCRRQLANHRTEWYDDPAKNHYWYSLSSRYYLFTNASQFGNWTFTLPSDLLSRGSKVLDFGAGVGTSTFDLACAGYSVDYCELNVLQKDFFRFRVAKRGITGVCILDAWHPLPLNRYDAIIAMDVFVMMPNLDVFIREQIAPALKSSGYLIESNPFGTTVETPDVLAESMQTVFLETLRQAGFQYRTNLPGELKVWQKR